MAKKLSAKTQELNPKLTQFSNSFSKCVNIEPETQELLLKRGTIYSVFEISGDSNFDTGFVSKVVNDILHDSYYQSENISPIQSMEKTISEMKDKIMQLSSDTLISTSKEISLNFVSAILWGNVLYVIRLGEIEGFTMRGGEIVPLEMISEGNFSSFSKLADEDDIFIFCTKSFSRAFPPEKLLSTSIPESDLDPNQTCLLIKLVEDEKTPQSAEIDLGLGDAVSKNQQRELVGKVEGILKIMGAGVSTVFKKVLSLLKPIAENISYAVGKVIPKRKMVLFTRKVAETAEGRSKKIKGWVFLSIIAVLLAVSVFYVLKPKVFKETPKEDSSNQIAEVTEPANNVVVEDKSRDEEFKIKRVKPEVFYDIKIADSEANPSDIQIVKDKLVVVDRGTGKIYSSDISSPNFSTNFNAFSGIKSLAQTNDLLAFLDNEGYKTYDIANSQTKDSYKLENVSLIYPYSGYIYTLSNDILTRNSVKDGALEGTLWGQNQDFRNAKSLSIAYSVYLLKENGELVNYSGGVKTDFAVLGLDKPFSDPVKVVADIDFSYIYVADKGNNRIVVLDEKGALVKQYKNEDDSLWKDIRGVSVSSDEKTLFILDSSKVYKLNVEE